MKETLVACTRKWFECILEKGIRFDMNRRGRGQRGDKSLAGEEGWIVIFREE